jgi:hypothetical protein
MKAKLKWPSPAMCVACLALFVALGGTSIAAVTYASRAGSVDGKSAVSYSASAQRRAGKLVATAQRGPNRGRLPAGSVAGVPDASTFGKAIEVVDNARGAQQPFGGATGIGTLTASCADQNARAGIEDPISSVQFVNQSGEAVNVTRRRGIEEADVAALANGTVSTLTIGGSNTFEFQVQRGTTSLLINGTIRQDGRGAPAANCLVYGTVVRIEG